MTILLGTRTSQPIQAWQENWSTSNPHITLPNIFASECKRSLWHQQPEITFLEQNLMIHRGYSYPPIPMRAINEWLLIFQMSYSSGEFCEYVLWSIAENYLYIVYGVGYTLHTFYVRLLLLPLCVKCQRDVSWVIFNYSIYWKSSVTNLSYALWLHTLSS